MCENVWVRLEEIVIFCNYLRLSKEIQMNLNGAVDDLLATNLAAGNVSLVMIRLILFLFLFYLFFLNRRGM